MLWQWWIAGAGGEPHFVGFDGERFDYHGDIKTWYRLWSGTGLQLDALFDLEPRANKYPLFRGTTFITRLEANDLRISIDDEAGWDLSPTQVEEDTGLARGLPEELQLIEGHVLGGRYVDFPAGRIVITRMQFLDEFKFLNASFLLKEEFDRTGVSGIVGQTLQPKSARLPNPEFFVRYAD